MGDEGVGVHAISHLKAENLPLDLSLVDGGTGGFHLLSYFEEHDPILIIDATMDGRPPGTLSVIEPAYSTDLPKTLSAHDIGLRDLIESAALLGNLPKLYLLTVSIAGMQSMSITLSTPVEESLKRISEVVVSLLNSTVKSTSSIESSPRLELATTKLNPPCRKPKANR
jgi:hydrogenase maturation protease